MFKTFEKIGEIRNVLKKDDQSFTMYFERNDDAVATATNCVSLERPAERLKIGAKDPPDQQSPLNIMNALNDDCLMEIFEWLHKRDLYTMASVCKRFRPVAVRVFRTTYKDDQFGLDRCWWPLSLFVDRLRIFGPTNVEVPRRLNTNIAFRAVVEYCPDLKEIDIDDSDLEPQSRTLLRSFLPKLRKIAVPALTFQIANSCGNIDWQLEELQISAQFDSVAAMPNIHIPTLKKLVFENVHESDGPSYILEFLARNVQVKSLELNRISFNQDQWCMLSEHAPNVEQLTIRDAYIQRAHNRVSGVFKYLTVCELDSCKPGECFVELLNGAPLKRLKLTGFVEYIGASETINRICRLTTITSLWLGKRTSVEFMHLEITDDDLLQLTRSLFCLQELCIHEGQFTLGCINRVLNESSKIVKLDIFLSGNTVVYSEPSVLDDISAKIAARPDLHVYIHCWHKCLKVSDMIVCSASVCFIEYTYRSCNLCFISG